MTKPLGILSYENYLRASSPGTLTLVTGTIVSGALANYSGADKIRLDRLITIETVPVSGEETVRLRYTPATNRALDVCALLNWRQMAADVPSGAARFVGFNSATQVWSRTIQRSLYDSGLIEHGIAVKPQDDWETAQTLTHVDLVFEPGIETTISFGGLWYGPMWRNHPGFEDGWRIERASPGPEMARSRGGQGVRKPRQSLRVLTFRPAPLELTQAYGSFTSPQWDWQQISARLGGSEPVLVMPRAYGPEAATMLSRTSIYGAADQWGGIEQASGNTYRIGDTVVRELL